MVNGKTHLQISESFESSLNTLRQNAEMKFNLIFIAASKTLIDVGGTVSVPRFPKTKLIETITKILRRKNIIEKHFLYHSLIIP